MNLSISDSDIDRIAQRVVAILAQRLSAVSALPTSEKPTIAPPPALPPPRTPKLAYSVGELAQELGLSRITIYRLEKRGLLKSTGATRRKIFSHAAVKEFLSKTEVGGWGV